MIDAAEILLAIRKKIGGGGTMALLSDPPSIEWKITIITELKSTVYERRNIKIMTHPFYETVRIHINDKMLMVSKLRNSAVITNDEFDLCVESSLQNCIDLLKSLIPKELRSETCASIRR